MAKLSDDKSVRAYLHQSENYHRLLDDAYYMDPENNFDYFKRFSCALELAKKEMQERYADDD